MTKRLFIALKYIPNIEISEFISEIKSELKEENLKWVDPKNIHLTLKFLGDIEKENIKIIRDLLKEISQDHNSFKINLNGIGAFYKGKFPSVLYLNSAYNEALLKLANDSIEMTEKIGFKKEERSFKAHITIARVKHIKNLAKFNSVLNNYVTDEFMVDSFYLIESILSPQGPSYNTIETFKFRDKD